jgi:hypothetical protein
MLAHARRAGSAFSAFTIAGDAIVSEVILDEGQKSGVAVWGTGGMPMSTGEIAVSAHTSS